MYEKVIIKPKKMEAKSANQEIYYGSQRTTLNKFFDEMLKKKIERFTKKLDRLKVAEYKEELTNNTELDLKPKYYEEEIIIQEDDSTMIDFTADLTDSKKDDLLETTHSISETALQGNPKLVPTLMKSSDSTTPNIRTETTFMSSKVQTEDRNFNVQSNLNHIPKDYEKSNDDDDLRAPRSGNKEMHRSTFVINDKNSTNGM